VCCSEGRTHLVLCFPAAFHQPIALGKEDEPVANKMNKMKNGILFLKKITKLYRNLVTHFVVPIQLQGSTQSSGSSSSVSRHTQHCHLIKLVKASIKCNKANKISKIFG